MMLYKEYAPRKELRPMIACYWTLTFASGIGLPTQDVVLPDGCSELILNLADNFERYDHRTNNHAPIEDYALVGQRRNVIEISPAGFIQFFSIRFKPYGLHALFDVDCSQITSQVVVDTKLRRRIVEPLKRVLEKASSLASGIEAVEEILLRRLNNRPGIKPYVKAAVSEILASRGRFSVNSFCIKHSVHKSTLEKSFLFQVGITPKEYASIIRFNYTYSLLKQGAIGSLTQTALEGGYYDQSHMIKDFKRYSGSTPSNFLKADYSLPDIALEFTKSIPSYFPEGNKQV